MLPNEKILFVFEVFMLKLSLDGEFVLQMHMNKDTLS